MSSQEFTTAIRRPFSRIREQALEHCDRETYEGILFSLPYLTLFTIFLLYPLLLGLYMSLFDWNPIDPATSEFVGIGNYVRMFEDPRFWNAVWNTLLFVGLTVPTLVLLSLGLALGVNREVKGKMILRAIFFSPYILTVSVAALIWNEMYSGDYGPVNHYLSFVVDNPPAWLADHSFAMPAIVIMTVWWVTGFNFVILLAARQDVPETLYEAARLDGANSWRAFRDITLPQMRNALLFVVIVQFIWSFQVFGQPFIMTGGGPGMSTETLVMYLYAAGFNNYEFGYAAAIGYFIFAVLVMISIANYYLIGTDDT